MKMLNKIVGGSLGVAAALALSASSVQAQNLLINGDFEDAGGFTANPITPATVNEGWANFGASQSDMSASIDYPESGDYTLAAVNGAGNNWNPQGAYQIVSGPSIIAGTTYTFSSYFLQDTAFTGTYGTPIALQIQFASLSPTNTFTSLSSTTWGFGDNGSQDGSIPALNTWYQGSVTATAPVGTQYALVYLFFMDNGQTANDTVYFDNASLTVVPEPATLSLVGVGLASSFLLIRRRKS
jgi:PEP-CTERM motif